MVMEYHPDIIDINMGCPAPKDSSTTAAQRLDAKSRPVRPVGGGGGRSCRRPSHSQDPQRVGRTNRLTPWRWPRCASRPGAAAITVHGRTRDQMYAPTADWDIIKAVKQAVAVPVIGNGDVFRPEDAARLLEETGCDAVMVGTRGVGDSLDFPRNQRWLDHHCMLPLPAIKERMFVMLKHIKRMCELKGERGGMLEARKHAAWYMKGLRGAPGFRAQAGALSTFADAERLAMAVLSQGEPGANPS